MSTVPLENLPEKYSNDPNVEIIWAIKAAESASIHMNIIMNMDTKNLKLNKHQDDVYARFRSSDYFPSLDVQTVDDSVLKNPSYKDKWRSFCEEFKEIYDEYNFGTMLRINANGIYDEPNTILTTKVIFLAIEGARNVEGINERLKQSYSERYKTAHSKCEKNIL